MLGRRGVLWRWPTQAQGTPSWIKSCWSKGDRQLSAFNHQENRQPLQISQGLLGSFERPIPSPVSILMVRFEEKVVGHWDYPTYDKFLLNICINAIVLWELWSRDGIFSTFLNFWHATSMSEATHLKNHSPFKVIKSLVLCPRSLWWLHGLGPCPSNTTLTSTILFDNNPCGEWIVIGDWAFQG